MKFLNPFSTSASLQCNSHHKSSGTEGSPTHPRDGIGKGTQSSTAKQFGRKLSHGGGEK